MGKTETMINSVPNEHNCIHVCYVWVGLLRAKTFCCIYVNVLLKFEKLYTVLKFC
jgi:hypothetical protein